MGPGRVNLGIVKAIAPTKGLNFKKFLEGFCAQEALHGCL